MSLTYSDIVTPFAGRKIDMDKFNQIGCVGEDNYAIYNGDWIGNLEARSLFGLTDKLYERWLYSGIEFNIYLNMDGDTIKRCIVDKFRTSEAPRPGTKVLELTQQELRIAKRILSFITK